MREPSSLERLVVIAPLGTGSGVVFEIFAPWQFSVLAGWDVAAAAFVGWVWSGIGGFTHEETERRATREDNSRVTTSVLVPHAGVASLVGVGSAP